MNPTTLTYLEDTYLFEDSASIIDSWSNEFWEYIILNTTIFYPQGWWQPTDTWIISINSSSSQFEVSMVRLDAEGIVYHYGVISDWWDISQFDNQEVTLTVTSERRITNAKNHTAGHIIDIAVKNIWLELIPTKWYHFEPGSYVEYAWIIEWLWEWTIREDIIDKLNEELTRLIRGSLSIIVENWDWNIDSSDSPEWKSYRFVYIEWYKGYWCGCGWTHVSNTSELWSISIRKVRVKKWNTQISYIVE